MTVKIGIPLPTSRDFEYNRRSWPQYAEAVSSAGGQAVRLELGLPVETLGEGASECAGFLLPGSPADVEPASYRHARHPATAFGDPAREACDRLLLQHASATGKPVLAVCFGAQMLNVWSGGALVQDLPPLPVNHAAGAQVAVAHAVWVSRESLLAGLLSAAEAPGEGDCRRLPVNSSHHQAIAAPGDALAIVGRSVEDGVVEAVEGRVGQAAMVGVQWHPERTTAISAASRALFTWLVSEAEDRATHVTLDGEDADAL